MSAIPNYAERRAFGRRPANMTGYVYLPGKAGIACTIKDISEGGALLEFPGHVQLTPRLRLMREGSDLVADCELRHLRNGLAGVQFLTEAGRQMAREMFKSSLVEALPPLAPAPPRIADVTQARGADLVQRFRDQRAKALEPQAVAETALPTTAIDENVPRDILSAFENALRGTNTNVATVPRPLAAHKVSSMMTDWPTVPRPLAAYRLT